MHILLSDTIDTFQIDATRQMLADFCSLLPELYDEKISTHNVHLFNKICEAMGTTVDTFCVWSRKQKSLLKKTISWKKSNSPTISYCLVLMYA